MSHLNPPAFSSPSSYNNSPSDSFMPSPLPNPLPAQSNYQQIDHAYILQNYRQLRMEQHNHLANLRMPAHMKTKLFGFKPGQRMEYPKSDLVIFNHPFRGKMVMTKEEVASEQERERKNAQSAKRRAGTEDDQVIVLGMSGEEELAGERDGNGDRERNDDRRRQALWKNGNQDSDIGIDRKNNRKNPVNNLKDNKGDNNDDGDNDMILLNVLGRQQGLTGSNSNKNNTGTTPGTPLSSRSRNKLKQNYKNDDQSIYKKSMLKDSCNNQDYVNINVNGVNDCNAKGKKTLGKKTVPARNMDIQIGGNRNHSRKGVNDNDNDYYRDSLRGLQVQDIPIIGEQPQVVRYLGHCQSQPQQKGDFRTEQHVQLHRNNELPASAKAYYRQFGNQEQVRELASTPFSAQQMNYNNQPRQYQQQQRSSQQGQHYGGNQQLLIGRNMLKRLGSEEKLLNNGQGIRVDINRADYGGQRQKQAQQRFYSKADTNHYQNNINKDNFQVISAIGSNKNDSGEYGASDNDDQLNSDSLNKALFMK